MWDVLYHNWALISILGTLVVLVLVPWLILRKYVGIARNIVDDTPPPLSRSPDDYERIEGEPTDFRSFDGHALSGVLVRGTPDQGPKGLIVFAHEYGSEAASHARYCRPLLEAGYDVMTFDFRGHGASSGEQGYKPRQWATDREEWDMLGAIAWAEDFLERHGRPPELGLFGISRGGCAAILAAVDVPSVRAIVTDGAFSTDTTIQYLMKRWATIFAKVRVVAESHPPTFWRFLRWMLIRNCQRHFGCRFPSVRKALQRLGPTPILLIHGDKDGFIPVSQSQMLYDLAAGPKYLWIVPTAKHNQSVVVQPAQYAERTVRFFDEHLAGGGSVPLSRRSSGLDDLAQPLAERRPAAVSRGE
jgi:pimeloyl-ACP methyl ester carboxylesterase